MITGIPDSVGRSLYENCSILPSGNRKINAINKETTHFLHSALCQSPEVNSSWLVTLENGVPKPKTVIHISSVKGIIIPIGIAIRYIAGNL